MSVLQFDGIFGLSVSSSPRKFRGGVLLVYFLDAIFITPQQASAGRGSYRKHGELCDGEPDQIELSSCGVAS